MEQSVLKAVTRLCLLVQLLIICVRAEGHDGTVKVINLLSNDTLDTFPDELAGFGPDFPDDGIEGRIVYADPPYACGELKNKLPPRHDQYVWILLMARGGTCQFADKVLNAQKHNYTAAIVHNSHNFSDCNSRLTIMGGVNGSKVTIPSIFVGCIDGDRLANEYSYKQSMDYIVRVTAKARYDLQLYLWPFAIVVGSCFVLVMIFLLFKFARDQNHQRRNRLSNKHLKKIPVRKFKKGDYYDTCAICLDEYTEGEKIRVLPCDHVYHTKCIDPWLTKSKKTCPVCKRRVIPGRNTDSDDSDSDNGNDGGATGGTSENTPLLGGGSGSSSSTGQYGGSQGAGGATVSTRAILSGPRLEEDSDPTQLTEESENRTSLSRQERRRRRRERRERAAALTTPTVVEDIPGENEQTGSTEKEQRRLRKEQKRKRRAERAERGKTEEARRADRAERRRAEEERQALLPSPVAEEEEEDGGFVSAKSSFREEPVMEQGDDDNNAPLLGAEGGAMAGVSEDYINPSYSESQEVHVPRDKREMNQLV